MAYAQTVASVLEQESQSTMANWLSLVEAEPEIITVSLTAQDRCAHLPEVFADLILRLRNPLPLGTRALTSDAACDHGWRRRQQAYTPAMMVEESRMLQVSIFLTLQSNIDKIEIRALLGDVMVIADEVDSQLAQAMASYMYEANIDNEPLVG